MFLCLKGHGNIFLFVKGVVNEALTANIFNVKVYLYRPFYSNCEVFKYYLKHEQECFIRL